MGFKRIIAIGDIHGRFDLLVNLLDNKIKFNHGEDQLIFLGDYIDRGSNSKQVVDYVQTLKKLYPENIVLLLGNHEDFVNLWMNSTGQISKNVWNSWMLNGGTATVKSYGDTFMTEGKVELFDFVKGLALFYVINGFVFSHAGIPGGKDIVQASRDELLWGDGSSYDGEMISVMGHIIHPQVIKYGNVVCVDTGSFYSGKLSGYDVLNDKVYNT